MKKLNKTLIPVPNPPLITIKIYVYIWSKSNPTPSLVTLQKFNLSRFKKREKETEDLGASECLL